MDSCRLTASTLGGFGPALLTELLTFYLQAAYTLLERAEANQAAAARAD